MNETLQKRIEEAAETLINYNLVDLGDLVNQYDLRRMLVEMGVKILQNQWISVDEALPEKIKDKNYSKYVLTRQEYYEHEYHVIARYDYGFDMWVSTNYFKPEFITHWMPIPALQENE